MKIGTKKILVELDALFDTRQAILGGMDPRGTVRLLASPQYAHRVEDKFENFDMDEFRRRYETRDKRCLRHATITPIVGRIHEFTQRVHNKTLNTPFEMEATVVLNTHPYVLSEEEKSLISRGLLSKLPLTPSIEYVDLPLDKLNPYYISREFSCIVLYHFNEWLALFLADENFQKYPCFQVTALAPARVLRSDQLNPKTSLADEFVATMEYLAPMIGVMFLPMDEFSSLMAQRIQPPSAPKDAGLMEEEGVENIPVPEFPAAIGSRPPSSST